MPVGVSLSPPLLLFNGVRVRSRRSFFSLLEQGANLLGPHKHCYYFYASTLQCDDALLLLLLLYHR